MAFLVASQSTREAQIAFTHENASTNPGHSGEIERPPLLLEKDEEVLKGGRRLLLRIQLAISCSAQNSHVRPRVTASEVGSFTQDEGAGDFFAANPPAALSSIGIMLRSLFDWVIVLAAGRSGEHFLHLLQRFNQRFGVSRNVPLSPPSSRLLRHASLFSSLFHYGVDPDLPVDLRKSHLADRRLHPLRPER